MSSDTFMIPSPPQSINICNMFDTVHLKIINTITIGYYYGYYVTTCLCKLTFAITDLWITVTQLYHSPQLYGVSFSSWFWFYALQLCCFCSFSSLSVSFPSEAVFSKKAQINCLYTTCLVPNSRQTKIETFNS